MIYLYLRPAYNIFEVYKLIKYYRNKRGISIRKLSRMTGISTSHIARLENGESTPTIRTLMRIAKALQVPPSILYLERRADMKSRNALVSELFDVVQGLSIYSLMRILWVAKHFRKKDREE